MLNTNLGLNGIQQTSNVGLNYANPAVSTTANTSIFGNNLNSNMANYENDMFMPECLKYSNITNTAYQQVQNQAAEQTQIQNQIPAASQQVENNQYIPQTAENYSAQSQIEDYTQQETPSLGLKKKGAIAGALIPVAKGLFNVFKGNGTLTSVFTKSTLTKCSIYGVVGLLAGALIESLFSKKSEQAA